MTRTTLTLVWLTVTCACAGTPARAAGDYMSSPVYYELHSYGTPQSNELLRRRTVLIPPYDPVDMTQFDWRNTRDQDFTWAMQMNELRFLLPLLATGSGGDRRIAREFFTSWHESQDGYDVAKDRAARYPMSIAFRAMVFVYYLKCEEQRDDGDAELVRLLRIWIERHQELLAEDAYFEGNSNHGLVEGLALVETTRVFPSSRLRNLGLDRMLQITRLSVSEMGVHMEHAPFYHFVYLRWLDDFSRYLESIPGVPAEQTAELGSYRQRMQAVAFYMHDHAGVVAPIGDSHATPVEQEYRMERHAATGPVLYDEEAGYAIYKGADEGDDHRYVVFTNQNRKPRLSFHYHNDAMSVFYSDDGETILNDPGAFTYTTGRMRSFFMSDRAHNTVYGSRSKMVNGFRPTRLLTDVGTAADESEASFWGAQSFSYGDVHRCVTVPADERVVVVADTFRLESAVLSRRGGRIPPGLGFSMTWNLGPDVVGIDETEPSADNRRAWRLRTRRGRLFSLSVGLTGPGKPGVLEVETHRGDEAPLFGWNAPRFGFKEPATTLVFTVRPRSGQMYVETRVERIE